MAGRLGEFRCWLHVRGRHVNLYVITTLFLIVVAVHRRGSTDDSGVGLGSIEHQGLRYTVDRQTDVTGGLEQLRPVIGVFLLADLDNVDACQCNDTLSGEEELPQVFIWTVACLKFEKEGPPMHHLCCVLALR